MADAVISALVAAVTALVVAVIGPWVVRSAEAARDRRTAEADVNLRYLAPLRQQLAEAVVRTHDLLRRIRTGDTAVLRALDDVDAVRDKPTAWFAGPGCYLMSTAYITAALFAELVRLRQAYPYLRLRDRERDAELAAHVLRLQLSLRGVGGIFYSVQLAIGDDLLDDNDRVASYPAFAEAVRDPNRGPWYHQLLQLYTRTADGHGIERLERALTAMHDLSAFLDDAVAATASISTRLQEEAAAAAAATPTSP